MRHVFAVSTFPPRKQGVAQPSFARAARDVAKKSEQKHNKKSKKGDKSANNKESAKVEKPGRVPPDEWAALQKVGPSKKPRTCRFYNHCCGCTLDAKDCRWDHCCWECGQTHRWVDRHFRK